MAIPRKGDPRRPLYLAVSSMRLLGVIFLFVGAMLLYLIPLSRFAQILCALCCAIGALYLVFSFFLKRYQPWAVTASLILAGFHELIGTVWTIYKLNAITLAWIVAIGQTIWHLSLSYGSIRAQWTAGPRGFETLPPKDVPPRG